MKISTELTPSEVANILRYTIKQNVELAEKGHKPVALNIIGSPGIAKTSTINQVSDELETHYYIRLNAGEVEGSGDITGFPLVQHKVCKNEECLWIGDKLLNDYLLQGYHATGESRMSYAKPEWLVGKEDKPVVLVLDDYNRGLPMVMNACMRITDEQEFISWSLPKGSSVILTCNPDDGDDTFNVSSLDSAQKTRMLDIKMKPSVNDWAVWAEKADVESPFINFLLKHPEVIEGASTDENGNAIKKGNLRIWTKFFHLCGGLASNLSDNWNTVFLLGQNSLPVEHLLMLNKFVEDKLDQLPEPSRLLKMNGEDAVKEIGKVIGKGTKKRVDISSILSRRIMNYVLVNHKEMDKKMVDVYGELMESEFLSPDIVLLSVKKTTKLFPQLINRPKLISILTT